MILELKPHSQPFQHLIGQSAKVILCSHLGRPKGQQVADMSLAPVAEALSSKLKQPVTFIEDCIGPAVEEEVQKSVRAKSP